jgi:hypothetical protein
LLTESFQGIFVKVEHGQVGAPTGESLTDGSTNATSTTCDNRVGTLQRESLK